MTEQTIYRPGDFYRICDQSGYKVRNSKCKKQWDNLIVRKQSWEARHPQDFVRGVADYMAVPEARPRPATVYVHIGVLLQDTPSGYGPPITTETGSLIYTGPDPVANE